VHDWSCNKMQNMRCDVSTAWQCNKCNKEAAADVITVSLLPNAYYYTASCNTHHHPVWLARNLCSILYPTENDFLKENSPLFSDYNGFVWFTTVNKSLQWSSTNQVMIVQVAKVQFYSVSVHWGMHNSTFPWYTKPAYRQSITYTRLVTYHCTVHIYYIICTTQTAQSIDTLDKLYKLTYPN